MLWFQDEGEEAYLQTYSSDEEEDADDDSNEYLWTSVVLICLWESVTGRRQNSRKMYLCMAAKSKEDTPAHGCNAAIQVKHRVHLITQPDMLTPKSWQQPCFDGTKWGWNFTLALFASSCHGCVVYCRHHIRQLDMVSIKYAQTVYIYAGGSVDYWVVNLPCSFLPVSYSAPPGSHSVMWKYAL